MVFLRSMNMRYWMLTSMSTGHVIMIVIAEEFIDCASEPTYLSVRRLVNILREGNARRVVHVHRHAVALDLLLLNMSRLEFLLASMRGHCFGVKELAEGGWNEAACCSPRAVVLT